MTIFVLRMISSWQNRGSTVKEENGEVKKKENKKISWPDAWLLWIWKLIINWCFSNGNSIIMIPKR